MTPSDCQMAFQAWEAAPLAAAHRLRSGNLQAALARAVKTCNEAEVSGHE